MKKFAALLFLSFLNVTCNNHVEKTQLKKLTPEDSISTESNSSKTIESVLEEHQTKDTLKVATQKQHNKRKKEKEPLIRYERFIEFPGDNAFNGKPMVQQLEMSSNIFIQFPDTLSRIAVQRYKDYKHFFPKAISDNFEEGISTEHIVYPKKLIFQFQVFENNYQTKPYLIKEIIIRRNEFGEPYAE